MAFTPFYKIEVNTPFTVLFLSASNFTEKQNQWGKMNYNYQVRIDGVDYTLSADEKLHPLIQQKVEALDTTEVTIVKRQKPNSSGQGKTNSYELLFDKAVAQASATQPLPIETRKAVSAPVIPTTQRSREDIFDARETLICRQTALKCAADNHQGKGVKPQELLGEAEGYFTWITTGVRPQSSSEKIMSALASGKQAQAGSTDEINVADIPF